MAISHPNQRVGIFVDVQNIYHSAKHLYHSRVNFRELLRVLTDRRLMIRAIAYVVKGEVVGAAPQSGANLAPAGREESFFEALRQVGMELRLKDLQVYPDGTKKADWDVGMAVDAMRMAPALDAVVLVTGDGDFVPLVEYLKWGMGKRVEVAAFRRTSSGRLRDAADLFIDLEKTPKLLNRIPPPRTRKTSQ
ncbi:MAG: NYN domain-containing protein [Candidatus Jorgensenbacteria bacterium]